MTLASRKEIQIQALPEVVWKIHTDIDGWSRWHSGVSRVLLDGPLAIGSIFRWTSGGLSIVSTIRALELNWRIGWTGKAVGIEASHVWTLEAQQGGTNVTTEESMTGWLAEIMKLLMPKMLDRSLDTWLRDLKRKVETGQ